MANTLLTPTIIARKALSILHQRLVFVKTINRQYNDQSARSGAKIGDKLTIRKPNQFTVRTGLTMSAADIAEESLELVVGTTKGVDMNFDSVELTLTVDDFAARYLEPAMSRLVSEVESDILKTAYKDVYNHVSTGGGEPAAFIDVLKANVKLSQGLAPDTANRHLLIDPVVMANMVDANKALFHRSSELERAFSDAFYGRAGGLKWWETTHVPSHTNGSRDDTTPLTNGVAQTGASLICDGFDATATIKKGDVFTIAAVFAVHPETKVAYTHLQQFVVTEDATAAAGAVTLKISPSITASGAKQTVSVAAADNSALVFVAAGGSGLASTAYPQHLAYHRDAFTLATADLEVPKNVEASRQVFDGISLRYIRDFDIINSKHPARFDVLYGFKVIRPEWATRLARIA